MLEYFTHLRQAIGRERIKYRFIPASIGGDSLDFAIVDPLLRFRVARLVREVHPSLTGLFCLGRVLRWQAVYFYLQFDQFFFQFCACFLMLCQGRFLFNNTGRFNHRWHKHVCIVFILFRAVFDRTYRGENGPWGGRKFRLQRRRYSVLLLLEIGVGGERCFIAKIENGELLWGDIFQWEPIVRGSENLSIRMHHLKEERSGPRTSYLEPPTRSIQLD